MTRRSLAALMLCSVITLTLSACGGSNDEAGSTTSNTTIITPTVDSGALIALQEAVPDAADLITAVTIDGQAVKVDTTIIDPRTENSDEAAQALVVCEAARTFYPEANITVNESDGTGFAVYQSTRSGSCVEY